MLLANYIPPGGRHDVNPLRTARIRPIAWLFSGRLQPFPSVPVIIYYWFNSSDVCVLRGVTSYNTVVNTLGLCQLCSYIWYSEEDPGRRAQRSPTISVPNLPAPPSKIMTLACDVALVAAVDMTSGGLNVRSGGGLMNQSSTIEQHYRAIMRLHSF